MTSSFSSTPRKRRNTSSSKFKVLGDHKAFLSRIKKTLYYGKLPTTERFSLPLTELATELYTKVKSGRSLDRLDAEEAASITRNACVSPCSLVFAILYLERLKTCNPDYLHRIAPSELFLVSLMVASKVLHDDGEEGDVLNSEWAASAGIEIQDINRYEMDFLQAIEWQAHVGNEAFWKQLTGLERDLALREGERRGWFTYTDLDTLLDASSLSSIAQALITISAICLTSYTASVLTLIGSAFIVSHVPGTSVNNGFLQSRPQIATPPLPTEASSHQFFETTEQVDPIATKFILSSLTICVNNVNAPFDHIRHIVINDSVATIGNNNWTATANWLTEFIDSSLLWWNHKLQRWHAFYFSMSIENLMVDKEPEEMLTEEFKFRYGINKSGIWEADDVWKEMRNWLLIFRNRQHQNTQFFPLGVTSHY